MRAHLNAVRDHLAAKGWRAYTITVPADAAVPYVLISPEWAGDYDPDVSGMTDDFAGRFQVTAVAGSVDAALAFGDTVRAYLSPRNGWSRVPVEGFVADVRWDGFNTADVDRDITGTALNNHRAFSKHTFLIASRSTT